MLLAGQGKRNTMAALCRVAATPHNRHGNVSKGTLLALRPGEGPERGLNLEKAVETAKNANHAKTQRIEAEARFTQREKVFIRSTPSFLAYLAYFAVGTAGFRFKDAMR